ncbi:GNAT family N-acetyltransferase [Aquimarina algiphila]|uniref:GNAT family N-acetyltransferase n=1 Tax=Aquimarina algiphila TaxID=2047982 RepID=UPI002491882D|nr:GNAT family N-acetyltransferase [Aquimarina algiphila]
MDNQNFVTARLKIRPTSIEDTKFIFELMNTPKWIQNIGDRGIETLVDAENYINNNMTPQLERLGYSNYTVIRKSDNLKIGICGLYDREGLKGIDLGFAFLPEYEKKGYAFESAQAIVKAATEQFSLNRLCATTVHNNFASQKLLRKLGFEFSKPIRLKESELLLFEIKLNGKH